MKFNVILLTLLSSVNVQASLLNGNDLVNWNDLDRDSGVKLTQPLQLKGTRGESFTIPADQALTLEEMSPLPGLSVVNYVFRETPCPTPERESEMAIILPSGNSPGREVGVSLIKGCALDVYVESKDLAKPSFFRLNPR